MSDTPNKKDLHNKHRERLRNRLKTEGPDHFEDHQLLEALLFFSIPRKDTNDTAHSLIEQTGSLSAVFAADVEQALSQADAVIYVFSERNIQLRQLRLRLVMI